jgi:hypothetical protein
VRQVLLLCFLVPSIVIVCFHFSNSFAAAVNACFVFILLLAFVLFAAKRSEELFR